jgi:hypothetical protein
LALISRAIFCENRALQKGKLRLHQIIPSLSVFWREGVGQDLQGVFVTIRDKLKAILGNFGELWNFRVPPAEPLFMLFLGLLGAK